MEENRIYKKGLTLMELMVVMSVLVVVTALLFQQVGVLRRNSRDKERLAETANLVNFIEGVRRKNNFEYPETDEVVFSENEVKVTVNYVDPLSGKNEIIRDSFQLESHLRYGDQTDSTHTYYKYESSRGRFALCFQSEKGDIQNIGTVDCTL